MKLEILVRGLGSGDKDFIGKMMTAAQITEWEIKDILVVDLAKLPPINIGIAVGKACGRMVNEHVKKLFIFPSLKQLQPLPENLRYRHDAWNELQKIKKLLEGELVDNRNDGWQYATVYLPGQKKIVIYEGDKPQDVEGDIFITKADSKLLLDVKEAFKAEAVVIGEESKEI